MLACRKTNSCARRASGKRRRDSTVNAAQRAARHSGLATVEVALTLPILIMIALATIDTCRVIFVRQSAKVAAYECARIAIIPGAKYSDVAFQCDAMMSNRKINDYRLSLSCDPERLIKGDLLNVTVSVPADSNSLGISWFYRGRLFEEKVAILVEHTAS